MQQTPPLGQNPLPAAGAPRRVVVVGTTGSGKTTFAKELAAALGLRHIELDALYHGPNWTPAEPDVFRERIAVATAGDGWVTDGNYRTYTNDITWERADTLVWLDYPIAIVLSRLFRRVMRRGLRQEELWNGNRESLRAHFLTRESLFLWALKTHWRHREEWPKVLAEPRFAHLRVVRVRSPRRLRAVLRRLLSREAG